MADFRRTQKAKKYIGRSGKGSHFGCSRRQSGSTLVELQGLMTPEDTPDCDDGVIMEKKQESVLIQPQNDGNQTKNIDGGCTATTNEDDKETKEKCIARDTVKSGSDFDKDSRTNEWTKDAIMNDGSIVRRLQSNNETPDLEITFQSNSYTQDCSTNRTNEPVIKGGCQRQDDFVELDLADAQVSPAFGKTDSVCLDNKNTSELANSSDSNDNTATVSDSTNRSVSIDLSDHLESTQGSQDRDIDLEDDTCRICHCGNETEVLISPCMCTGTVKYIHHSCLMDWLKRCVKTKCELCLQNFSVHRKTKPLKKWRRPDQKPTPIIWLLTFVVALTLNIASIAKDGSQKCVSNPCIIFYVVGALGAMLGFAFFYHWLIVSIRYMKQWMALNEEWTLVGSESVRVLGNANLAVSNKSIETKEHRNEVEVV